MPAFRYSPLGLRDGMLAQMLADTDTRASVHRAIEEERWSGVLTICKRYNVDHETGRACARRCRQALQRFTARARPAAGIPRMARRCGHDERGWQIRLAPGPPPPHLLPHRQLRDVQASALRNAAIVAAIARYLGKSRPDAMDRPPAPGSARGAQLRSFEPLYSFALLLRSTRIRPANTYVSRRAPTPSGSCLNSPQSDGAELEQWSLKKEKRLLPRGLPARLGCGRRVKRSRHTCGSSSQVSVAFPRSTLMRASDPLRMRIAAGRATAV